MIVFPCLSIQEKSRELPSRVASWLCLLSVL